ncbi:MAG: hypothetical protein WCT46_05655 [Candidatus Gracilibacteria bacterium]|jgi:glutathione synthase/RimK-type ligase-like ATP-grasp enzyme
MKTVVFVTTPLGTGYALHIGAELEKLGFSFYTVKNFEVVKFFKSHSELNKENVLICVRTATPLDSEWILCLEDLEKKGFTVVNSPKVLRLTSHKLNCALFLQDKVPSPRSWGFAKGESIEDFYNSLPVGKYIAKPFMSLSQGAYVGIFHKSKDGIDEFKAAVDFIPEDIVLVQEFVDYKALYRVIVINHKALNYSFVDKPMADRWKVSVCLNDVTMEYVPNPDKELLELAEKTQELIGGNLNYIDLFEIDDNGKKKYIVGEINTACSLFIHEKLSGKNIAAEIANGLKTLI